jgi:hypothetical protein
VKPGRRTFLVTLTSTRFQHFRPANSKGFGSAILGHKSLQLTAENMLFPWLALQWGEKTPLSGEPVRTAHADRISRCLRYPST